jgi:YVTN family beta-propeller protein
MNLRTMKSNSHSWLVITIICGSILSYAVSAKSQTNSSNYKIFVSNEKSGDLTVISGTDFKVIDTIPVGKRPRGIHASPDGKTPSF